MTEEGGYVSQCGRQISALELEEIRETVGMFWRLSRWELAQTICEHLGWRSASGSNKVEACMKLLERLESLGEIRLPGKGKYTRVKGRGDFAVCACETEPGSEVVGSVRDVGEVSLEVVLGKEATGLWNGYVSRYHYLGYKRPFGNYMRYFIRSECGVLGCIMIAGAAKSLGARDRWIGWSDGHRLRNLGWVINNTRFLIFPWVKVRTLASHVLGQLSVRITGDWCERWRYSPVLMESFVDPRYFDGSCYKGANWEYVGMTTGEGLVRPGKRYRTSPKRIFMKPLVRDFRKLLCSDRLSGEVEP
jgi:hypothetical protein